MCRSGDVADITCAVEWNHPPACHSERTNVSRGIYSSSKLYLVLVPCSTWWIPPLRLRCGRNDRRFCIGCYKSECPTCRPLGRMAMGHRRYSASSIVVPFLIRFNVRNVSNRTCLVDRNHLPICHFDRSCQQKERRNPLTARAACFNRE